MFDVTFRESGRRCDGVSRRDFLRVGALSGLGLGLPQLLQAAPRSGRARAKSVVLIFLGGGLSHHDTFDPKPDASVEIRGKYKPIATSVSGLQIGELLPLTARQMDKLTLVRSGAHNNDHHETASNWVLSGRFGSPFGDYPAMGAVVSHELGFGNRLPPYVAIPQNPGFTWELGRSAFLGGRYESFKAGDPNQRDFRVRDVDPIESLSERRSDRRHSLLQAVDDLARRVEQNDQLATYDELSHRAIDLALSKEARSAFAISQEGDRLRERYGRNTFGQSALLARRLVERGVRFVTVSTGGWDHHSKIFESLERMLPDFDRGFSAFIEDMDMRGLLAETLVVVMGEFGRTPKVNGNAGRDHWGQAASLLFAGAGVGRGQVVGATDKHGAYVTRRPVAPADVACTVYEAIGVDPRKQLRTPDGRPVEILDQGETVRELFA
jgi:hypothetical protein